MKSAKSINVTIERYLKIGKNLESGKTKAVEENTEHVLEEEVATMSEKIKKLEECKEKLMGVGLESYTVDELQVIETDLDRSLKHIRARKFELFKQQIEQLRNEERKLVKENEELKKSELQVQQDDRSEKDSRREMEDVETGLFLGPPLRFASPGVCSFVERWNAIDIEVIKHCSEDKRVQIAKRPEHNSTFSYMASFTSNINNLLALDELQVRVHTTNSTLMTIRKVNRLETLQSSNIQKNLKYENASSIETANKNIDK
ncbi:hypothetical protein POM88_049888 [Heracleum sosnowskyi]|uniref:K-box domain-containing protein n=1 Tax=Heracleum sosnowskyi TaxID=360622 RepID=A0AAD8GWK3_9APIA|nr:hypothetical protein POM88_049888 [Heracleum sosnowskyi]